MSKLSRILDVLAGFTPDPRSAVPPDVQRALALARYLQARASELQTTAERRQQAELDRMLQNPRDKATLVQMTDQSFRSRSAARIADQFTHILDVQGIPRFFSPLDRALLRGFQAMGELLPSLSVPLVKEHLQQETTNVILPAEPEALCAHLRQRREAGVRMNINFLGEAILSEPEARRRLEQYLAALELPATEVCSVKISTLYSQISPLAREQTLHTLCDRLETLFRHASSLGFERRDGRSVSKFIYLDMEEYRDLSLTAEAFMRTLDRPGLSRISAGLALQAYVPDSHRWQRALTEWARRRVSAGGAPITIRIVKGANLEMERFEAATRGWPQAPFKTKRETDANFKRMLQAGFVPENLAAVHLGIASHNLFDLAYGLVLALDSGTPDRVQFEMLEGMANHQRRALSELLVNLLLYAPVCEQEHFLSAIGYLVRRLDENTGPENFLRHAFQLTVGSPEWRQLETGFVDAFKLIPNLSDAPRRQQDRHHDAPVGPVRGIAPMARPRELAAFANEPDTDWSLPQNGEWAQGIVQRWEPRRGAQAVTISLVVDGVESPPEPGLGAGSTTRVCLDPSRPGVVVGRYRQAGAAEIDQALRCAAADADGWRAKSHAERRAVLRQVAVEIRRARAELIGAALANAGKTIPESDPEHSEAVDFLEFYADSALHLATIAAKDPGGAPPATLSGRGVVVVVSPWNFPLAIPCGGVAAALAAGNTVILKPASDAVLVAWELCQCFWRGGVSRRALQFVPCSGSDAGAQLVSDARVNAVILTGGTATAQSLLARSPSLSLFAETGGKNATIVTALADRDQAIKNVLHSAFSHAGQKCSATSLLLLEAEVYDDPKFKRALCEAVESLRTGSAWDLATKMGPLIRPPAGDLERALRSFLPGESWAVQPRPLTGNPHLWSPGVKWGVAPGSDTHLTEFFGPVLGVMRFEKLSEAIDLVNQTGYGLTSGLESLDDREQAGWRAGIRAGNLYLNRSTVGAIVLRQPFGGCGRSSYGPGLKAGGPNYLAQFMTLVETNDPAAVQAPSPFARRGERDEVRGGRTGSGAAIVSLGGSWNLSPSEPEEVGFLSDAPESPVGGSSSDSGTPRPAPAASCLSVWRAPLAELERTSALDSALLQRLLAALDSYEHWAREEFLREHDHFRLPGQDNLRRYLPASSIRVRVHAQDSGFELFARVLAARALGATVTVSAPPATGTPALAWLRQLATTIDPAIRFVTETDADLARRLREGEPDRIRYAGTDRVPDSVRQAARARFLSLSDAPVVALGRVELLWYLTEQSVSFDYHRYGNLGSRAAEPRAQPA